MKNVQETPYARWLEGMIRQIMESKPVRMGMVMVTEDGDTITAYYGDRSSQDIASMAWHMNMDSIWETIGVNADKILQMGADLMEAGENPEEEPNEN